jgi:MFS family permease
MLSVLAHETYRRLFLAQVIALLGTGLATVALGLLAYDLAGAEAGAVLGTALAIKMIAYVGLAPFAAALAERLPRRGMLVVLDLVRGAVSLSLPFVSEIWQVYVLIFILQAASAAFTPAFQATIPDVLPDEKDYTRALSLSRLAYDLESLVSPILAAALLTLVSFHALFAGTAAGFAASAAFVLSVTLPAARPAGQASFLARAGKGLRIYLATPRLRGLLALNLAVAAGGALVIVNTVVYVQGVFGLSAGETALALAAFGGGSMLAALVLPRVLERVEDRPVMMGGAGLIAVATALAAAIGSYGWLLPIWFMLGAGYGAVLTPGGRLLRRSAHPDDRPALFAAQFALSHGCWLVTYPLAGLAGAAFGLPATALILSALAVSGVAAAIRLWPAEDEAELIHEHPGLAPDHPHLAGHAARHAHAIIIDDLHPHWPRHQGGAA